MSKRMDYAQELFLSGFNCCQSVFGAFCENYGLNQKMALKVSSGFGGGMRNAEICGAVSGAALVIGLKYGQNEADDTTSKSLCNEKVVEFTNRFKQENSSILCKNILSCDISTEEGMNIAKEKNHFKTTCVDMVRSAVQILEALEY